MKRPARTASRRTSVQPGTRVPEPPKARRRPEPSKEVLGLYEKLRVTRGAYEGLQRRLVDYVETFKTLESERDSALQSLELLREEPARECQKIHLERNRLPDERWAATQTFRINGKDDGVSAHVHCGERAPGDLAEVFVRLGACHDKSKPREDVDWESLARRLGYLATTFTEAWATSVSIGLQYGVPLKVYLDKHTHQQDVPGYTGDAKYPRVSGLLDYVSRWMRDRYCKTDSKGEVTE